MDWDVNMSTPMDDLPDDLLDDTARAAHEFGLNKRVQEAVEFVHKGINIKGLEDLLNDDFWLCEVLRDVKSTNPGVRSRALEMLGKYIGALQAKGAKAGPRKVVEFESE